MGNFDSAIGFVLGNEGGYEENPNDAGGATNFGISLRFLKSLAPDVLRKYGLPPDLGVDEIRNMTRDQAIRIYRGEFWDHAPFEKIINGKLCNYIFDCCVQHGIAQGIKIAQHACLATFKDKDALKIDGVLGSHTIAKINYGSFLLMPALLAERAAFCRRLAKIRKKDEVFLQGWLKRCYRI